MIQEIVVNLRANFKQFKEGMNQAGDVFLPFNSRMKNLGAFLPTLGRKLNMIPRAFKGIGNAGKKMQMQFLSLMFAGLGLKQAMSGLLKPALEASGLFELWGAVLQVLFLPIALALLELLMPLFMWLMNLDEGTKLLIGKWVLFGLALGAALFVIGSLVLAIGAIVGIMAGLFSILKGLIPEVSVFGINISSIVESLMGIAIVKTLWEAFSGIIGNLTEKFFGLTFVKDTMEKMGITITDQMTPWQKFKEFIGGVWDYISGKVKGATDASGDQEGGLLGTIKSFFPTLDDIKLKVKAWMEEFKIDQMIESINKMGAAIGDLVPKLSSVLTVFDAIASVINFISDALAGLKYLAAWQRGGRPAANLELTDMASRLVKGSGQTGIPYVPHTGLYKLHAGETVSQAGSNSFNSNITVNASSNVDIEMLKTQLSRQWADDLARLTR